MIDKVKEILSIKLPEQKSEEWFRQRKTRITSSVAASCLPKIRCIVDPWKNLYKPDMDIEYNIKDSCNNYESFYDFYKKKTATKREFFGNIHTAWGNRYEDVITKYYEKKQCKHVNEIGLLPFRNNEFLAASPDGVCDDGTVLEIKCPRTRKIDGIPTLEYWIQMQFHLQATELFKCDFLECEIYEYSDINKWEDDFEDHKSGIVVDIQNIPNDFVNKCKYFHDCVTIDEYKDSLLSYLNSLSDRDINESNYIPCFYKIRKYSLITVNRDDNWFNSALPYLKEASEKIKEYTKNPNGITKELDVF